jgi:hypothetical protein
MTRGHTEISSEIRFHVFIHCLFFGRLNLSFFFNLRLAEYVNFHLHFPEF